MKILIIKNKIKQEEINPIIEKYKKWWIDNIKEPLEIEFKDCDRSLQFKDFGVARDNISLWGIDNLKTSLDFQFKGLLNRYDGILFIYNPSNHGDLTNLANWTYPNSLNGAWLSEIIYKPQFDVFAFLAHETIHGLNRWLMFRKVFVIDDLDIDNNWDRNLARILPALKNVQTQKSLITKMIELLKNQLAELLKKKEMTAEQFDAILRELHTKFLFSETSGYRTIKRNKEVGGVENSKHLTGKAKDIILDNLDDKNKFIEEAKIKGLRAVQEQDHIHLSV